MISAAPFCHYGRGTPKIATKESLMPDTAAARDRLQSSLRSADGFGVVRIEARLDAALDLVWSALTETEQLAHWYGEVEGELRVGGDYCAHVHASGWEGTGHVEECEPSRRFLVTSAASDDRSDKSTEVTLNSTGDQTILVVEQQGLPLDLTWAFGAGLQIHVEDLAAHVAGGERVDAGARFGELEPTYKELAAKIA
jgi:uncharacterized protein YndB with AHSA1/START domain